MRNNDIFYRGDIVWVDMEPNMESSIQAGKRPYLIISNNKNNEHSTIYTAIPLTTKEKKWLPIHHHILINGQYNTILIEQISCISKFKITEFIDTIDDKDLNEVEEKLKIQLGLKGVENGRI